jgi:hypothetical protein
MSNKFFADSSRTPDVPELDLYSFHQGDKGSKLDPGKRLELDPYIYNQGDFAKSGGGGAGSTRGDGGAGGGGSAGKNKWLPDIQLDGADKVGATPAKPQDAGIERDSQGRISKITYPGGAKVREFGRDADGNLNSVVSRDAEGQTKLVKENNSWFADVNGKKLPLPGNVELSASGDYSLPLDTKTYKTEKSDGTVCTEKVNSVGARVATNKDGNIERISRRDGSIVEARFQDGKVVGMVESTADGKQTTWDRIGDVYQSRTEPPKQRVNFAFQENGNTSYIGTDGYQHIIRGAGNELLEGPGKGKYGFDSQGRIQSIQYADGKTVRSFGYDGDSLGLNKVSVEDTAKHKTTVYTREGSSDKWTMTDAAGKKLGTWKGERTISCDGIYSEKSLGKKTSRTDDDSHDSDDESKDPDDQSQDGEKDRRRGRCNNGEPAWMDPNWSGWYDFGKNKDTNKDTNQNEGRGGSCRSSNLDETATNYWPTRGCDGQNQGGRSCPVNDELDDETDDQQDDQQDDQRNDRRGDRRKDQTDDQRDDDTDEPTDDKTDDQTDDQTDDKTDDQTDDKTDDQTDDSDDGETDDGSNRQSSSGVWHSFNPDGSQSLERVSVNGDRALFDKHGALSSIRRADGSAVESVYKNKKLTQVIESKSGERVTWSRKAKGEWTSDSSAHTEVRRDLKFNSDGDMSFKAADGVVHTIRLDGSVSEDRTLNQKKK